jgi:hypothetical protein
MGRRPELMRVRSGVRLMLGALCGALALFASGDRARADDGYDTPFARAVRAATEQYRLQLWAADDGYVQSTTYVASFGVMYTNHQRFDPADLAHPTVLIYDEAGRLVAVEYQFTTSKPGADFSPIPASAWFDIPRHLHYNIVVNGTPYYAQAEWPGSDEPTAEDLLKRGLMPAGAKLVFAFVHPATRSVVVWAWLPNSDGLFSGDNSLLP